MNRSGIAWIQSYHGLHSDLTASCDTATGFADALGAEPAFPDITEDAVIESLFERGGGKPAYIENSNIFYYAGHASENGLALGVDTGGNGTVAPAELTLGGPLAYAVFDACSLLHPYFQEFLFPAFEGLHYMLGFAEGSILQDATRGSRFAGYLNNGCTIPEAWRTAVVETVHSSTVPWSFLRAIHEEASLADEYWSNDLSIAAAPQKPFAFVSRTEKRRPVAYSRATAWRQKVRLFRTPAVAPVEERMYELAASLGMSPHQVSSGPGWQEQRSNGESLRLYEGSGSFWWKRPPVPLTELFLAPEPALLPAAAIERAQAFVEQLRVSHPRVVRKLPSFTVETQSEYRSDGSGDGQFLTRARTVARHNNYGFVLDGLPVFGPGAKARISFEGEEISEVFGFWREPVEDGVATIEFKEEAEVKKELRASEEFAKLPPEAIALEGEPRLGYYARSVGLEQPALVPVFEVRGVVATAAYGRHEFTRFVNAVPSNPDLHLPELIP